jgi:hypothetical protein
MERIGAQKIRILKKEVTNGAYWYPKNQDFEKRGHQWSVLVPKKSGFWKKRSPMERNGAQKIRILEKEVTNGVYWCPKNQDFGKRGHQWSVLMPKKVWILKKEVTNKPKLVIHQ